MNKTCHAKSKQHLPGANGLHHFGAKWLVNISGNFYLALMSQALRHKIQQEYTKRVSKNSNYSLRAFSKYLGLSHATLSSYLSGKRKITKKAVAMLAPALNLSPEELAKCIDDSGNDQSYTTLQNDLFLLMSEWYFDAILELTKIPSFKLTSNVIAQSIGISELQARLALETLLRAGLLKKKSNGKLKLSADTTNDPDPTLTTPAKIHYQKSVLEKSLVSLESVDRPLRDHTSTTMAIRTSDLPEVKRRIRAFRSSLDAYLQRANVVPDEVYQLQVSFFPVSNIKSVES